MLKSRCALILGVMVSYNTEKESIIEYNTFKGSHLDKKINLAFQHLFVYKHYNRSLHIFGFINI